MPRVGKMSRAIFCNARPPPSKTPMIRTMTVRGRRRALAVRFITGALFRDHRAAALGRYSACVSIACFVKPDFRWLASAMRHSEAEQVKFRNEQRCARARRGGNAFHFLIMV